MGRHSRPRDRRGAVAATITTGLTICGCALLTLGVIGIARQPSPPTTESSVTSVDESVLPAPSAVGRPSYPSPRPASDRRQKPRSDRGHEPLRRPSPGPVRQPGADLGPSKPVGLRAPATDLRVPKLVTLGLTDDGTLAMPTDWNAAGWYAGGPAPGEPGPAVIAGHVDSVAGPAVFFHLAALRVGDEIALRRADGKRVGFTVYKVATYPKTDFPTEVVYGDTAEPELRLITCGGEFDHAAGHYRSNVVVFARLS